MKELSLEKYLTRRSLFRFASHGILALPLMNLIRQERALAGQVDDNRFALFIYIPSGIDGKSWFPKENDLRQLPTVSAPLEPFIEQLLFFKGFDTIGPTNHSGGPKQVFAGGGADSTPLNSLDQILASKWTSTRFNRLALGIGSTQSSDGNLVSWKENTGVASNDNPKLTFASIFGAAQENNIDKKRQLLLGRKRVLDYLIKDYKRLSLELGSQEKLLLQSHVEALDEMEVEINRLIQASGSTDSCLSRSSYESKLAELNSENSYWPLWYHKAENTPLIASLHRKMMVEAISCGLTKVGLLQYGASNTQMPLNFEGKTAYLEHHHNLSHQGGEVFNQAQRSIVEEVAWILKRLNTPDMSGSKALDQGLVFMSSCLGDKPNYHNGDSIPCFIAGNANGRLASGQCIEAQNEPYNKILLTVMEALDEKQKFVGNRSIKEPIREALA